MAVVTLLTGRDVRGRFARGLHAVVTGAAIAFYGCVINKRNGAPRRGDVAVGALAGRQYVISRLDRGTYDAARRVTAGANGLRRTEGRSRVACLATYIEVRAVQHEAGTEMVEVLPNGI